ncbi:MAG TPA: D-Ala-D-Ala carboxypeptidase family metallohydrolase [Mesorhizobium sp.]|uniref:YcbK family protein n=1 Tax=Mesorhizobium sp. TaxID=1871066 RepID=UPI002DDCDD0F|nr:D-Ala-D-Ala carboxypeptidase family metallohydrolase [Mesorhizobium sp.]HEV2504669.1 D-Ala-D-Ala carboxypeptidase family metallohydrolase [Mesorhizobium sp.]
MAALCALLLASCTSTGAPDLGVADPNYAASQAGANSAAPIAQNTTDPALAGTTTPQTLMTAEGDTALPEQIAYLPTAKPGTPAFPLTAPADAQAIAGNTPQQLVAPEQSPQETAAAAQQVAAGTTTVLPQQGIAASQRAADPAAAATQTAGAATSEMNHPVYVTAGEMPAAPAKPEKKGFLASLFGSSPAKAAPVAEKPKPIVPTEQAEARQAIIPEDKPAKPIITLASAEAGQKQAMLASVDGSSAFNNLPGVRKTALFEITRRSGTYDDSDVDLNEDDDGPYQVASAAGMARLAPNGLLKQTESVDVACLKPSLVRVLKQIEGHYRKKLIVTSGYRDQARNVRARGAKNSLHMYCAAADIQIAGVSKWDLATYVRSLPGRGGVGTYCHTESVHVDVGPERDWNWRCRRRG